MGHRPVDRNHLSHTCNERSHNTERYRDIGGGKTRQAKSSFREDSIIVQSLCLHWKSASSTLTLIRINVPFILNICNVNQLVLIWGLTGISTRYRGQGLKCVVPPGIVTIAGGALKLISYLIHSVN